MMMISRKHKTFDMRTKITKTMDQGFIWGRYERGL